ncbi:MAG TPA: RiPP maturation radical SAM C-methyltransferase [Pyrinomonadaceae bacterium]|nr:RiPP maturation radical SAM C-methyltransferase [Pyrinomonadaceae bacterium]
MDVVFAVMPFADVNRPAIGVSLLKAGIEKRGFESAIEYFNVDLAEMIGYDLYEFMANTLAIESMVGEWFFADLAFGDSIPHESDYVARMLSNYIPQQNFRENVLAARKQRREYIKQCADKIAAHNPKVVGLTTTFNQTCACLALARALKERPNPPVTIIGGANCEGEMGLQMIRSFPWLDYVSTGEGDVSFPLFLERLLREGNGDPLPGILKRGVTTELTSPEPIFALDDLPIPDFSEFYARIETSPLKELINPVLLIETSRGCWWGAKQHCTFCGLNGNTMAFRSKSPERAFDELAYLSSKHGLKRVDCVDNILDTRYITTLFPRLSESDVDVELFYEVKANLRYDQLATLRAGGLRAIQPGIESLSNEVLRLMKKGCTGLQNIQLLRWCDELGIEVAWNVLAGFAGESPDEYQRQAELVPLLTHLQSPVSCSPIRLDRFSPFFMKSEELGLKRLRPKPGYYYSYPLGRKELSRLAYFFDFDYDDGRNVFEYLGVLQTAIQGWWDARKDPEQYPRLDAQLGDDEVVLRDTRAVATKASHTLTGLPAQIYLQCDSSQSLKNLQRHFGAEASEAEIQNILKEFLENKLTIEMEGQYLSLAVIRNRRKPEKVEAQNAYIQIQTAQTSKPLLHLV